MAVNFGGTNVPEQYQGYITAASLRWGVSPAILAAQLNQESGFNPNSVSPAGAVGIAQFLPSTAKDWGVNPYDVHSAIDGMAMLDAHYLKQFGSIELALAAYNAGPGNVSKYGGVPPFAETQNYVKTIMSKSGEAGGTPVTAPQDSGGVVAAPVSLGADLHNLTTLTGNLLKPDFWKRASVMVFGAGLAVVGVWFVAEKKPGTMQIATKIGSVVK